jgi:hypothetical protein
MKFLRWEYQDIPAHPVSEGDCRLSSKGMRNDITGKDYRNVW